MQREDNLAAAGFIVKPANTLERQQMLHRLPPHTFVQRANGDVIHYFLRIRSCVAAYMWAPSRRTTPTKCISNSKISPMSKPLPHKAMRIQRGVGVPGGPWNPMDSSMVTGGNR